MGTLDANQDAHLATRLRLVAGVPMESLMNWPRPRVSRRGEGVRKASLD
jgi:hypothetical protein